MSVVPDDDGLGNCKSNSRFIVSSTSEIPELSEPLRACQAWGPWSSAVGDHWEEPTAQLGAISGAGGVPDGEDVDAGVGGAAG